MIMAAITLSFSAQLSIAASGKSRLVHNPARDAKHCVTLSRSGPSRNWQFVSHCNGPVEVFWCFVQSDGRCRNGGTWTIKPGWNWSAQNNQPIRWGACMGKNSGGMDRDSNGQKYTCHEW